jgi:hypothetical protein
MVLLNDSIPLRVIQIHSEWTPPFTVTQVGQVVSARPLAAAHPTTFFSIHFIALGFLRIFLWNNVLIGS